jgi:phosphoglycolate phosphatase-like HAD superfamily hydrolase
LLEALREGLDQHLDRLRQRGCALPGAAEALAALTRISGVVQSVLTGNIRPNAIAKLAAFDLDRYIDFDVGAFGSDHAERSRLVRIAQFRAGTKYKGSYDQLNTVLIGDTPRDVQAGLYGGARTVGVATGASSKAELVAAGADTVLSDLTMTARVVDAVFGRA